MKKKIAALMLVLVVAFPTLAAAQFDDVVIGVTDSSMMENQVLEWFLLNNGSCSRVQYVSMDAA